MLIENAYYILTPGGQIDIPRLTQFMELISSLGAIPLVLTYEEHDYITAAVSHLPHIIASTLVKCCTENGYTRGKYETDRSRRF